MGTEIVRPSAMLTTNSSSVKRTSFTRRPGLSAAEMVIPRLQDLLLLVFEHPLNPAELVRAEAEVAGKPHGIQPKLRRLVIAIDMRVRWFSQVVTVEVNPVRTRPQYRRHAKTIVTRETKAPAGEVVGGLQDKGTKVQVPCAVY